MNHAHMSSNGCSPAGAVVRLDPITGEVERIRAGPTGARQWLGAITSKQR